jgi:Protein of unknown function (DUF2911)
LKNEKEKEMKFNKFAFVIAFVLTAILFAEVALHADEADESTKLTFSKPVEIPGQVLPAGTYLFKLADRNDLNLVRIFNADGTRLYATLQTISTDRPQASDDAVVVLAQERTGGPEALLKWFYSGSTSGHQLVYLKQQEQQLAQSRQQTIQVKEAAEAGD